MIYVALLRGINVGGNNKVDMKKLKITFEELGYTNVVTYINSGNIIFEAKGKKEDRIVKEIELAIKKDFALEIKVLIRDFESIKNLCKKIPDNWVKNETMRTDVMFLWEEFDNPKILEQLKLNPVDNTKYLPGAVVWNIKDIDYNKSGMPKLVGTKIYKQMTIRNINTVRKIFEIMSGVN
jgi:uncharacterized protein (DUF1697 family)